MKITDLLKKSGIALNPSVNTKEEAINKLVDLMDSTGRLNDKNAYKDAVLARESLSTTGIGDNIAIPHAKTTAVKEPGLSAMVLTKGIDYDSLDGEPAKLFFMIAAPEGENNVHLDVLARLSMMLMDPDFKNQLINAKSVDEFLALIDSKEDDKVKAENAKEEALKLFEKFGMDASTAVNIFFKKVVQTKSIPFEISAVDTNYKTTYDMSKEEFMGRVQSAIDNRTV